MLIAENPNSPSPATPAVCQEAGNCTQADSPPKDTCVINPVDYGRSRANFDCFEDEGHSVSECHACLARKKPFLEQLCNIFSSMCAFGSCLLVVTCASEQQDSALVSAVESGSPQKLIGPASVL